MKKNNLLHVLLLAAACLFLGLQGAFAQFPQDCGMVGFPPENANPTIRYGGRHITSTGILRVLVVWVRFADDNVPSSTWPNPTVLPQWARRLVDTAYSPTGNYYSGTASDYFYENSYGKMHVIGDVYYIITDSTEAHYRRVAFTSGAGAARSAIQMEALNKIDNPPYNVDFRRYDNWKFRVLGQDFQHEPGTDNKVDMIWFMTREIHDEGTLPRDQIRFRIGWATLDCPTHVRDGVTILGGGLFGFPASGIGMFGDHSTMPINSSTAVNGTYTVMGLVAHEMSHYFFGGGHFAVQNESPRLGIRRTSSSMKSYAGGWWGHFSGYEKWRLGWLAPTVLTSSVDWLVLHDMATTTDSTKHRLLRIPIPGTSQYYLIENRRHISAFETRYAPNNINPNAKIKPGILVYHIVHEPDVLPSTIVQMLCADGKRRWRMVYNAGTPGNEYDDVIDKDTSDAINGYDEREYIYVSGYPSNGLTNRWAAGFWPAGGHPYGGGPYLGVTNFWNLNTHARDLEGDSLDLFGVGEVISPWSNPGSHRWLWTNEAFVQSTLGFEIKAFNPSTQAYTLAIRLSDPEQLAPSKPQDLRVSVYRQGYYSYPRLDWPAMQEPDVTSGGKLFIHRRIMMYGIWDSWVLRDSVSGTNTWYVDHQINTAGSGPDIVEYKIQARDTQNKLSVFSDVVSMRWFQFANKAYTGGEVSTDIPNTFELSQNYPNPFNPSTTIRYQLAEDGIATLQVFDILGREVATLVKEFHPAGYYSAAFSAAQLSSGVYFIRFTVTDDLGRTLFTKMSKLLLAR